MILIFGYILRGASIVKQSECRKDRTCYFGIREWTGVHSMLANGIFLHTNKRTHLFQDASAIVVLLKFKSLRPNDAHRHAVVVDFDFTEACHRHHVGNLL